MVETSAAGAARLESFRTDVTGYCYRMLGCGFDAEDAVQETMLRAWRSYDRYDHRRASLRTWLFRIATHVCIDMLRSAQRRAQAMDLGRAAEPGEGPTAPLPERTWVQPVPEPAVLDLTGDPAQLVEQRETVRLAFVAALQHLAPRQRAVLILRDVLAWRADEVAHLLETTPAAVNSALQRARTVLRSVEFAAGEPFRPADPAQRQLLARYVRAFERHDVDALVSLLREDATMAMPPFGWWVRGRDRIGLAMSDPGAACEGARLVATAANGTPAFWQTRPDANGRYTPFGLVLLDVRQGQIAGITTYLNADRLLGLFERHRLS